MPPWSSQLKWPHLVARWLRGHLYCSVRCLRSRADPLWLHSLLPQDNNSHPQCPALWSLQSPCWLLGVILPSEMPTASCSGGTTIMDHAQGFGVTWPTTCPPKVLWLTQARKYPLWGGVSVIDTRDPVPGLMKIHFCVFTREEEVLLSA